MINREFILECIRQHMLWRGLPVVGFCPEDNTACLVRKNFNVSPTGGSKKRKFLAWIKISLMKKEHFTQNILNNKVNKLLDDLIAAKAQTNN